jgi:hypothetical protein
MRSTRGCALIRRHLPYENGGASNLELVSLVPGEPSSALFTTPADYREVPPSAFLKPPEQCDASCAESRARLIERLDAEYYKYRVR